MKKFSLLILLVISLSLVGCNKNKASEEDFTQEQSTSEEQEVTDADYVEEDISGDLAVEGSQQTEEGELAINQETAQQVVNELPVQEDEDTESQVVEDSSKDERKLTFKEKYPSLFAFRFDGQNVYIDSVPGSSAGLQTSTQVQGTTSSVVIEDEEGGVGDTMQETTDVYTDITGTALPGTLRLLSELTNFELTSERQAGTAVYQSKDGDEKITVEVVTKDNIESVKKRVQNSNNYSKYDLKEEGYNSTKEGFKQQSIQTLSFTERNGREGSIITMMLCELDNGNYIVIKNKNLTETLKEQVLKDIFDSNMEWVEE